MRPTLALADGATVAALTLAGLPLGDWAAVASIACSAVAVLNYLRTWSQKLPACSCPSSPPQA